MDEATSAQRNRAAGRCIADDERELANLAQWVNTQRKEYKENKLSVAQIKQLNDMGEYFVFFLLVLVSFF